MRPQMPESSPTLTVRKAVGTIAYLGGFIAPPSPFVNSLRKMDIFSQEALCGPGDFVHVDASQYGLLDWARNQVARRMLGDWLLFVDADHTFEPDLCARLVTTMYRHDLDVLTGLYPFKHEPTQPVLYMWNEKTQGHEIVINWDRNRNLFPVDSAGGGCLLIRRRLLERLMAEIPMEGFFDRIGAFGEDHSFFARVRKLGVQPYCAWKIQCGHLTYHPVQWDGDKAAQVAERFQTNEYHFLNQGTGVEGLGQIPSIK
jgi:hypothetical protein